jgi:lysophospholipase L1-like esterase
MPEQATVLCYGDSNTHGMDPVTMERLPRSVRWPGVVAAALGDAVHVIEEGLSGRTTVWDDPFAEGRNGRTYLLPCLRSHAPIDVVVLMLGSTDLKSIFGRQAHDVAEGVGSLVDVALTSGTGPRGGPPRMLVVAPPRMGEVTERGEIWGFGAARERSTQLARLYAAVAAMRGAAFLDAASLVGGHPADGLHLDAAGHATLGAAVAEAVRGLLATSG